MNKPRFLDLIDSRLNDEESLVCLHELAGSAVTAEMLVFAAQAMRQRMINLDYPEPLLDICGTGGDRQSTLNISSATSLILAAAGVKVAKHGNRAVSSTSGSSEVMTTLGVATDLPPEEVKTCLDEANLGFCFAPRFHPRLRALAPLRKQLGVPTLFNWLGPLCNPARLCWQVLGVGKGEILRPMAEALAQLDIKRAAVVHGEPGLDEVSLQGVTKVCLLDAGKLTEETWTAGDFGLPPSNIDSIRCNNAGESAAHILSILKNEEVPGRPWVFANAAAGLWIAGKVKSLPEGVQQAAEVVRSGQALQTLTKLQSLTNASRPASN